MDPIVIRLTLWKFGLFPLLRHMHQNRALNSTTLAHIAFLGAIYPDFLGFPAP
jgi:hypothetical protein